jgi:hypothetical protein
MKVIHSKSNHAGICYISLRSSNLTRAEKFTSKVFYYVIIGCTFHDINFCTIKQLLRRLEKFNLIPIKYSVMDRH